MKGPGCYRLNSLKASENEVELLMAQLPFCGANLVLRFNRTQQLNNLCIRCS